MIQVYIEINYFGVCNMQHTIFRCFAVISLIFISFHVNARCDGNDVVYDLDRVGITAEVDDFDDGIWSLKLWKEGRATMLYINEDDGDLTFRTWYGEAWDPSLRKANRVNEKFRFAQTYVDDDGDMVLSYYVDNYERGCSSYAKDHTRTWWSLKDLVNEYMDGELN